LRIKVEPNTLRWTDDEAMAAFDLLAREEGIMPASKAPCIAHTMKVAPKMKKNQLLIVKSIRSWR